MFQFKGQSAIPDWVTAHDVNLIVRMCVDYQCGHHMDALIKREILSMGSIERNCSKGFHFDVIHSSSCSLLFFFKSGERDLAWATQLMHD